VCVVSVCQVVVKCDLRTYTLLLCERDNKWMHSSTRGAAACYYYYYYYYYYYRVATALLVTGPTLDLSDPWADSVCIHQLAL